MLSVVTWVRYRAPPCIPTTDVNLTVSTEHLVRLDCEQESGLKPPGHIGPGLQVSREIFISTGRQSLLPVLRLVGVNSSARCAPISINSSREHECKLPGGSW